MGVDMKALLASFEKISAKYQARREHFVHVVERFKEKGDESMYQRCNRLIEQADLLMRELKHELDTMQGNVNKAEAQSKVKALRRAYKDLHELTKPSWRQWLEAIGVALVLALILRNFLFGLYHVPTGSAEKTILVGDRIWGNKMAYYFASVKRGDLVIFDDPRFVYDKSSKVNELWQRYVGFPIPLLGLGSGAENWVKRVIAVPGDTIEGRVENGRTVVYLNGKKLNEPYVNTYPLIHVRKNRGFIPWSHIGPLVVPSFLHYTEVTPKYTYDPSKSFNDQPYYKFNEEDVIHRFDSPEPELDFAFTPCYKYHGEGCYDVFGPLTIPDGYYWVMGDSRKNSQDSRWWGFLEKDRIHGRASFVIYSIDSEEAVWLFDLIKHPIDFFTKHIRWNRFFRLLNGQKAHYE
jgi:signal peptidase I